MVIETWRKVYNGKIINIIVKHDDWWYQAFVKIKENSFEEKYVDLMNWQKIEWHKIF